ncbi:hypothetical protein TWF730_007042 [Orbilia blumenaviensis]|uniref:Uncharacterized protein n=1 Tax=Orbilia blumenaviensis TaxID=1796055 RepID=A0AAV9VG36_9PEZI
MDAIYFCDICQGSHLCQTGCPLQQWYQEMISQTSQYFNPPLMNPPGYSPGPVSQPPPPQLQPPSVDVYHYAAAGFQPAAPAFDANPSPYAARAPAQPNQPPPQDQNSVAPHHTGLWYPGPNQPVNANTTKHLNPGDEGPDSNNSGMPVPDGGCRAAPSKSATTTPRTAPRPYRDYPAHRGGSDRSWEVRDRYCAWCICCEMVMYGVTQSKARDNLYQKHQKGEHPELTNEAPKDRCCISLLKAGATEHIFIHIPK